MEAAVIRMLAFRSAGATQHDNVLRRHLKENVHRARPRTAAKGNLSDGAGIDGDCPSRPSDESRSIGRTPSTRPSPSWPVSVDDFEA